MADTEGGTGRVSGTRPSWWQKWRLRIAAVVGLGILGGAGAGWHQRERLGYYEWKHKNEAAVAAAREDQQPAMAQIVNIRKSVDTAMDNIVAIAEEHCKSDDAKQDKIVRKRRESLVKWANAVKKEAKGIERECQGRDAKGARRALVRTGGTLGRLRTILRSVDEIPEESDIFLGGHRDAAFLRIGEARAALRGAGALIGPACGQHPSPEETEAEKQAAAETEAAEGTG